MSKQLVIGIIGTGRIGKLHTENIAKNFPYIKIKAVADPFVEAQRAWAQALGIECIYTDYKEILRDAEINAVLICSSTNTHAPISIEAAQAGKNIFCEKPIDSDVAKIHQVLAAVEKAGVKFQIGFNRRFDHNFRAAREAIVDGRVGELQIVKITSRDPAPPPIEYVKVSGGMFFDMTIHDFDMARYLTGSEVVEVYANAAVTVDPAIGEAGDVDTALISLKFANGAIGIIDNCRKAVYGYDQRIEVLGTKAGIHTENDTLSTLVISDDSGVVAEKPKYIFLERYMESFANEMREFFDAIINDKPTPVGGIDGLKPVLIAKAAIESVRTGRPVRVEG